MGVAKGGRPRGLFLANESLNLGIFGGLFRDFVWTPFEVQWGRVRCLLGKRSEVYLAGRRFQMFI